MNSNNLKVWHSVKKYAHSQLAAITQSKNTLPKVWAFQRQTLIALKFHPWVLYTFFSKQKYNLFKISGSPKKMLITFFENIHSKSLPVICTLGKNQEIWKKSHEFHTVDIWVKDSNVFTWNNVRIESQKKNDSRFHNVSRYFSARFLLFREKGHLTLHYVFQGLNLEIS